MLAPPWVPIPPPAYGGIELVVGLLGEGLARRGHEVVLVAAPGSRVEGVRIVAPLPALPPQIGSGGFELSHILGGLGELAECDVVVDHSGPLASVLLSHQAPPVMHVVHGPLDARSSGIYAEACAHAPNLRLAALSQAQRRLAPGLPYAGVCGNGVDVAAIPFRATSDGYLAFLGRMSPEKGADAAIAIARAARLPLRIAAKCREPEEIAYFERVVEPHLGPDVEWLGEIGPEQKYALLGGASALVFPIDWPEPFGMVMVEAMACGTPVLATRRGSVPEVVRDGVTGFVRDEPDQLVAAVERLADISRVRCRAHVERNFSAEAMTLSYERLLVPMASASLNGHRRLSLV